MAATVTLADVATRAGVSAATVSRVLSGNYPVAEATRARVMRAVEELQYVVNGPASALAAATSDLVGVLVNDIADPFFGIMAGAVQSEMGDGAGGARSRKLAVVCNTGGSPERELTYLTLLQRQRAAAVVLTGGAVDNAEHAHALAARLRRLAAAGTRIVLCGRPPLEEDPGGEDTEAGTGAGAGAGAESDRGGGPQAAPERRVVTLAFDNRGGARRLTEHLLALGHTSIGYVAGPAERTTTRHRLEGHRLALRAHDAAPAAERPAGGGLLAEADRLTVHGGAYDRSSGYDGALELLRRAPDLTAVLAANDTVALGICAALRERGLRIPEDVSVAGYDDLPFSADASPALTTVRLPLHDAGARAGRLALGHEAPPPGGVATVRAELMARASTGPPSHGRRRR
jgi:LacI family transcriptional regulator